MLFIVMIIKSRVSSSDAYALGAQSYNLLSFCIIE
jgi:hypothetical protein